MIKIIPLIFLTLTLASCAENFTWEDSRTWRFEETEEQKAERLLKESCLKVSSDKANSRVLLMNGVNEYYAHSECIPHTQTPLSPQRMEGR